VDQVEDFFHAGCGDFEIQENPCKKDGHEERYNFDIELQAALKTTTIMISVQYAHM
jgi:hypothetical protein